MSVKKEGVSMLANLFADLPLFDETETGKPNLEDICKELGIKEGFEPTQEELAKRVTALVLSAPMLYEALRKCVDYMPSNPAYHQAKKVLAQAEGRG